MTALTTFTLMAHSGWRWVVLILIIFIVLKTLLGWLGKQKWTKLNTQLVKYARFIIYVQIVLGLILFILRQRWTDMQFFGEHVVVALLAVGGVEFGAARSKKVSGATKKFKFAFIGFALALLLIIAAIGAATQWQFM